MSSRQVRTIADLAQEEIHQSSADLVEVLLHGGQRWPKVLGDSDAVEADDGDIIRNPSACFVQGVQHAGGGLIVGAEDSGDVRVGCESLTKGVAGRGRPVAPDQFRDRTAGCQKGVPPGIDAQLCGARVRGTCDVVHGVMSEAEEMLDSAPGPFGLISADRGVMADEA